MIIFRVVPSLRSDSRTGPPEDALFHACWLERCENNV